MLVLTLAGYRITVHVERFYERSDLALAREALARQIQWERERTLAWWALHMR